MANDALLQAAIKAARTGDLEEAAVLFARLVKEEPASEQGWLGLGFCFSDHKQREYCFRRVLAINPNNVQAGQALGLLDNPEPAESTTSRLRSSQVSAVTASKPQTKPAVSPFTTEEGPIIGTGEPVILQTTKPLDVNQKAIIEEKKVEAVPVPPEPIQEEKPNGEILKPKRTVKPLAIILLVTSILLLVCAAGIGYLFLSGKFAQFLPAIPAPTWTVAQIPTQPPSPTYTETDTPTATASPTPPLPTLTSTPAVKPTVVYNPAFEKTACEFTAPEGITVTCGYVSVPEDRTNQHTKTIQLAVVIFHSTNAEPAPDPVVFLQGGPGGQAVLLSAEDYELLVKPFLSKRDFIAFDQRGTGLSIPALGCDELENVYKQDISGQIPVSSRDYIYTNAFRSCHGAMTFGGIELNSFTTQASSDDIKDIITVLGYKQVDLYGASYGTRLALVTMRDHPEIVKSAVLDSVVPVDAKLYDEDPIRYNSALQALFDGCAAEVRCNKAYPDLKTVFWNLVDQLDAKPVSVTAPLPVGSNTEKVDGGDLIGISLALLKTSRLIAYAPETIYKIKSGDFSTFVSMQSSLPYEFEGINIGLYISMMCHEQILATTPLSLQATMDSAHDVGRYFRLPFFGDAQAMFNTCKVWGAVAPAAEENAATISAIPALVIEGKYDPATPPIFGKQVAAQLSHSFYMEFPNQGHTPTAADTSGCAFGTMLAFFDNPNQKPDMTCLGAIKGVDFVVP
jgi:pimeloyl-ACP methyl ester carboxylesterase